ncbi:zinc-ribbon domain-containing protein [Tatumella sp. JGM118]|uniref:YfgJ family double zinc ribbon protein n=1 Tax=Tatumella sp. JGM118 TaxID=2799796 RepID=UPI001BB037DA|nr:zinc-ribbon domain-containing protein [Tatumella sp. JGM118]MBS0909048.1 zinc ribbon domain-containing protein [Tatumella sp. JGM118]
MNSVCLHCQIPLSEKEHEFICPQCQRHYLKQPCCPVCHQALEVLKACGAVDYFCPQHGLQSRTTVVPRAGAEKPGNETQMKRDE